MGVQICEFPSNLIVWSLMDDLTVHAVVFAASVCELICWYTVLLAAPVSCWCHGAPSRLTFIRTAFNPFKLISLGHHLMAWAHF